MKNDALFPNIQKKHVAQVTGAIALVQIINANRLQFTSNNSNKTFNSAQLTCFPARTVDDTPKFSLLLVASVYTPVLLVVTSHGIIQYILYISCPNRDIEKMIAFSGIKVANFVAKSPKWLPSSSLT
ncbi:hypothetical protein AVEN_40523-1 [Araneus ventricosus]|uniref:Uncharacterized protein n=1 Tax=Araneus ventricosus TaxID=182803 RepID=A0A4Y2VHT7_ARAVE|nr:hypothetical protein AVEN_40523-1 [Araneus ventricosus]